MTRQAATTGSLSRQPDTGADDLTRSFSRGCWPSIYLCDRRGQPLERPHDLCRNG